MTAQQRHLSHPKYRPDIDGLRAVAVLAVVVFHAFPNAMKGGFIGVDVFFVISGYLISTVVFENLDRGTFSFSEFYGRRIKRIFPALILVLVACIVFGWFALLADEYKQIGRHIAAGAMFVSNFALWKEAGYFDNAAQTKPLLHLWSLGIEEQFYIIWPLVLWFAWKRKLNPLAIVIFVAVVSFLLNVKGINQDAVAAFYSPQTRFWELASGGLLAWLVLYEKGAFFKIKNKLDCWLSFILYGGRIDANSKTLSNLMSFSGLFLLAYGFWHINDKLSYPGTWALVPVLGTVLIISAGSHAWANRVILSNKIAVWIGLISFPLYLWHWPLLSFARILERDVPSRTFRIVAVITSIALAWLTFKFIERPVRLGRHDKTKVTVLVFLMVSVGYGGYFLYRNDGIYSRYPEISEISKAAREWEYPGKLSPFQFKDRILFRQNSSNNDITLFVGDSNAEQYYVRADQLISINPDATNSVVFASAQTCLAIPKSPFDNLRGHCDRLMENAFEYAVDTPDVRNVVLSDSWYRYLVQGTALNGVFGYGTINYIESLRRLSSYIGDLKKNGKNVYLILPIPNESQLDPKNSIERDIRNFPNVLLKVDGKVSRDAVESKYKILNDDLRNLAEIEGAHVISPLDFLCDSKVCPSFDDEGEAIYRDEVHLGSKFVRYKASYIDDVMTYQKR